jgi:hypothetical protein
MGNCFTANRSHDKSRKCHVILHKQKDTSKPIDLKGGSKDFEVQEFMITQSGYLLLGDYFNTQGKDFYWTKAFKRNQTTVKMGILKMDLTKTLANASTHKFVENCSFGTGNYRKQMWEVLNYKPEMRSTKGIQLEENDVVRFGSQILKVALIQAKRSDKSQRKQFVPSCTNLPNGEDRNRNESQKHKQVEDDYDHDQHRSFQVDFQTHHHPQNPHQDSQAQKYNEVIPNKEEKESDENQSAFRGSVNPLCRVCLEAETEESPFHRLCGCHRRMPTHLSCLRKWLMSKSAVQNVNTMIFYDLANVSCEICKQPFPSVFYLNGVKTLLMEPELPEKDPFLVLEIFHVNEPTTIKALIVINMTSDAKLNVGRGIKNDIIFKHSSVSHYHAVLEIHKSKLYLNDQNSRHGTFKLVDDPLKLGSFDDKIFNIGKWMIEFHPFKGMACDCYEQDPVPPRFKINPFGEYHQLMVSDLINQSMSQSFRQRKAENFKSEDKENMNIAKVVTILQKGQKAIPPINPSETKEPPTEQKDIKISEGPNFDFNGDSNSHLKFLPDSSQEYLKDDSLINKFAGPSSFNIADDQKAMEPSLQILQKMGKKNVTIDQDEEPSTSRRSSLFKSVLRENEVRKSMFYKIDPSRLQSALENGEVVHGDDDSEVEEEYPDIDSPNILMI